MDDPRQDVLRLFDRTAWIITASAGGRSSGLVATFVSSASLVPAHPRLAIGIARHHYTWELINRSRSFAAHLVDEAECALIWRFGLSSGRSTDKFEGLEWRARQSGSPIITRAVAWLDCAVEADLDIGDRTIYVGAAIDGGVNRAARPLTFDRILSLANAEQRMQMDEARHRDEELDAAAMLEWRAPPARRS
jgi:flavin reductase (DIM6/NTAB) family NADH-FMN oxidoreductase RutF